MASYSFTTTTCFASFQVHATGFFHLKPSIPPNFGHLKASLASTVKPFFKELQKLPMRIDVHRTIKDASERLLDAFVDSTFRVIDQPLLPSQSNFAPIEENKDTITIACIEGEIPVDFPTGAYIRNGPNPLFGGLKSTISIFGESNHIWVEGEGMLHALYVIKDNNGRWNVSYKNRYVETETLKLEKQRNKLCFLPTIGGDSAAILVAYLLNTLRFGKVNKYISNTNVFEHSGKLYSVAENYVPQEFDIHTLETFEDWDLNGSWNRPFTSHPKKAPGTGELIILGADAVKPYLVMGVISADGKKLLHKMDVKLERGTLSHDLGVTQQYNVIIDHPLVLSINRLVSGGQLLKYDKEAYARIGVMPRYGDADSVRWFHIEPHCTLHLLNCFEDGNEVVVRGCGASESIIPGPGVGVDKFEWFSRGFKPIDEHNINSSTMEDGYFFTRLYEWRLNMETGEVKEKILTGTKFSLDFPVINGNFTGIRNKYGYMQVVDSIASSDCGLPKYGKLAKLYFEEPTFEPSEGHCDSDEELIKVEYHTFGKNNFCSGAAFVSNPESFEEDDGWIISFVHDEEKDISQVHIIDVKNFESDPIAIVSLPQRVPYGFHGIFASLQNDVIN